MAETTEKKKISMIPAKPQYDRSVKPADKRMKVAAYCCVSTELEQQESSYEAQVEYYTNKIEENPNWKNAGIYADDGKSATNTKKRDDFNAMIGDALDGKIKMVLTKSVSRFARNTVDALITIRKLKEKNVAVVFEKEGVNTLDGTGEILLTILSSLAQEESRNISENTRWGVVRRFEKGQVIVNHNKFMGYTKNEKGELVIVPEEAEIVRTVFWLYLEGYSAAKISAHLQEFLKTFTSKEECADEEFDRKYRAIADEMKDLKKKRAKVIQERRLADSYEQRLEDMEGYIKKVGYLKREFDDDLVRRLIQTVKVLNENWIEVQFQSGIVLRQEMLKEE